jgi:hypothetical protein
MRKNKKSLRRTMRRLANAGYRPLAAGWNAEILKRMEELASGKVKPVPLAELRRRLSLIVGQD